MNPTSPIATGSARPFTPRLNRHKGNRRSSAGCGYPNSRVSSAAFIYNNPTTPYSCCQVVQRMGSTSDAEVMRNRVMTKGRRTPFQTPRSRLYEPWQREDSPDISKRQSTPYRENDPGGYIGKAGGSAVSSSGRGKDGTKGVSTRLWNTATNIIHRTWRKVFGRFGKSRVS